MLCTSNLLFFLNIELQMILIHCKPIIIKKSVDMEKLVCSLFQYGRILLSTFLFVLWLYFVLKNFSDNAPIFNSNMCCNLVHYNLWSSNLWIPSQTSTRWLMSIPEATKIQMRFILYLMHKHMELSFLYKLCWNLPCCV